MAEMEHHDVGDTENPLVHHEESDVNVRAIFGYALGLVVVGVIVHLAVWGVFRFFDARESRATVEYPLAVDAPAVPPEPRLQETPRLDLQQLHTTQEEQLNGYSWVDRDAGVVRIPIEEAMRLTLERGLPVRGQ